MTPLRQRMREDMRIRNLAASTPRAYVEHVSRFARHFGRSPAALGPEEIRAYQIYLPTEKPLAPASLGITVAALRFLYTVTLQKTWAIDAVIPAPRAAQTLPVVLSPAEVVQFLDCVTPLKHRTILTTCSAAGLRISEAVRLTPSAIDSQRMVLRIAQGTGQTDRYVLLSPPLLQMVRDWWRVSRSRPGSFPAIAPEGRSPPARSTAPAEKRIDAAGFTSPSHRIPCDMRAPSISSTRAPTSARFNCYSAIGVSRPRPGTWRSPRRGCAPRRAPWICARAPSPHRPTPRRPPTADRLVDGSPDADGGGCVPPLRRHLP